MVALSALNDQEQQSMVRQSGYLNAIVETSIYLLHQMLRAEKQALAVVSKMNPQQPMRDVVLAR